MAVDLQSHIVQVIQWKKTVEAAVPEFGFCTGRKFRIIRDGIPQSLTYNSMVKITGDLFLQMIDIMQPRREEAERQIEGKTTAELDLIQAKRCCDLISETILTLEGKDGEGHRALRTWNASCIVKFNVRVIQVVGNFRSGRDDLLRDFREKLYNIGLFLKFEARDRCLKLTQRYKEIKGIHEGNTSRHVRNLLAEIRGLASPQAERKGAAAESDVSRQEAERSDKELDLILARIDELDRVFQLSAPPSPGPGAPAPV